MHLKQPKILWNYLTTRCDYLEDIIAATVSYYDVGLSGLPMQHVTDLIAPLCPFADYGWATHFVSYA